MQDELWKLWGPQPEHKFCKGDFRSILFAKFASKADRDTAVHVMQKARLQVASDRVWSKPDQPLEKRLKASTVLGAKHVMVQWGWAREDLWADTELGTLWLGNDQIIKDVYVKNMICVCA